MNSEAVAGYTRRIVNSNRSELIVVLFDILQEYMNDANEAIERKDREATKQAIRKASETLQHLKDDLDFKYEIAGQLYPLYTFCQQALAKAMYQNDVTGIAEAKKVILPLAEAFKQVAKQDTSDPLMKNTQQVVAGYTYGKTNLTESTQDFDTSRGFLA